MLKGYPWRADVASGIWRRFRPPDRLLVVPPSTLSAVRQPFRALAVAFVPEIARCSPTQRDELERIVSDALASRPAALQRQVLLFIWILDGLSLARHGRRLARLDLVRRTALLERLAHSRRLLLRRGVWGLRTLVMMGWYAQHDVQEQLGYGASAAGWAGRR